MGGAGIELVVAKRERAGGATLMPLSSSMSSVLFLYFFVSRSKILEKKKTRTAGDGQACQPPLPLHPAGPAWPMIS